MMPSTSLLPASKLETSDATEDFHPLSLPTRLTLKSSASTFVEAKHSPYKEDLLTPPLTNPSLGDPPFRPTESDHISLSMKRHHGFLQQKRRRQNRACVSSGDVDQTTLLQDSPRRVLSLSHSKSAPSLTSLLQSAFGRNKSCKKCSPCFDPDRTHKAELASHPNSPPEHPRRWTISGKAAPTRVLTSMSPSAVLPEHDRHPENEEAPSDRATVETPAMITLQRAASNKSRRTSLRPEAYTSFPTPAFSKTRSGFVTTLFGDGWRRSDNTLICTSVESVSIASQSHCPPPRSARASIDHGNAHPSHSTMADPVYTDVVLDSFVQSPMNASQPAFRARRCSTKYVSGASTYEIIWDENVSTSSSSGSRRTSAEQTRRISLHDIEVMSTRRPSMAVDKLEIQLSKGIEQSRKSSSAFKGRVAVNASRRGTYHKSFHSMLNFQEAGRDAGEEFETSMRSRASTTSKQKSPGPEMEIHFTTVTCDVNSTQHMGFFPPLSSTPIISDAANDPLLANPWRTSWENGNDALPPLPVKSQRKGSMIGHSTGMRKKSIYKQIRKSRKISISKRTKSKVAEQDRRPLLGQFNGWSDDALAESHQR